MSTHALELWGGVECTVNRVGDRFFDQMERNGHAGPRGEEDLRRFADLGFRALRYPVLWERLAPDVPEVTDWSWPDRRLGALRDLGVRPIVGLTHHGSGPRRTDLLDPGFAPGLADYARQVAARYPWVQDYTPVNEPLTTARFAGLYGHWYPHGRETGTFVRAFLHQCHAVVLAMRAIREINPAARLIQTEDLGKTHSTAGMAHQAEFENQRRWLTWDLLAGRVDETHPLWEYLRGGGTPTADLLWFAENPCPPDVLGINTYVTSERFLDERLDRYPAYARSANARGEHYADVVAVRAAAAGASGPGRLLREAWERYGRPLAITEAHLACTREEQMRWVAEIWRDAQALRECEHVDVRAVTLWALLGSFDWSNLLTRADGDYEPGVFDLRAPRPRATGLAHLARALATHGDSAHPTLAVPGWWRRPARIEHGPVNACQAHGPAVGNPHGLASPATAAPLLIVGDAAGLGRAFSALCEVRGLPCRMLTQRDLDPTNPTAVEGTLNALQPWAVVHAGANPGGMNPAEADPARCWRENVSGPAALARACAARGVALVAFSSDLVFGDAGEAPRVEDTPPAPRGLLGRAQAVMERAVLDLLPGALVVRCAALFGPWEEQNVVAHFLGVLEGGQPFPPAEIGAFSLTYVPDLVHACLDLLLDEESGRWHLVNSGPPVFWADLARRAGFSTAPSRTGSTVLPRSRALASQRAHGLLPSWESALDQYLQCRAETLRRAA